MRTRHALLVALSMLVPLAACHPALEIEPLEVRPLAAVPAEANATFNDERGGVSVGDAYWIGVRALYSQQAGKSAVLLTLTVTNRSDRPAWVLRSIRVVDDHGTAYESIDELDPGAPTAARSDFAEPALAPGASRRLERRFLLAARREIRSIELPALSAVHGERIVSLEAIGLSAP